jgi:hypothetical protein
VTGDFGLPAIAAVLPASSGSGRYPAALGVSHEIGIETGGSPHTVISKNALFAESDGGERHCAPATTLVRAAKPSSINPTAWLPGVLERVLSGQTKDP